MDELPLLACEQGSLPAAEGLTLRLGLGGLRGALSGDPVARAKLPGRADDEVPVLEHRALRGERHPDRRRAPGDWLVVPHPAIGHHLIAADQGHAVARDVPVHELAALRAEDRYRLLDHVGCEHGQEHRTYESVKEGHHLQRLAAHRLGLLHQGRGHQDRAEADRELPRGVPEPLLENGREPDRLHFAQRRQRARRCHGLQAAQPLHGPQAPQDHPGLCRALRDRHGGR
mmetsp:Transcript_106705/g.340616  ORF Transcript_106705/g.340616 Transcript_106705/m.340616 type:complete len:229 (-) Transcript_106705:3169-3855(-)